MISSIENNSFLTIDSCEFSRLVELTDAITNPPKKQPSSIDIPSDWVVNNIMNITASCPKSSISFEKLCRTRNNGETKNLTKMKQTPEIFDYYHDSSALNNCSCGATAAVGATAVATVQQTTVLPRTTMKLAMVSNRILKDFQITSRLLSPSFSPKAGSNAIITPN